MRHHQQIYSTRLAKAHIIKSRSGFTIIELMIVIAVVGILLGVAVSNFETLVYGSTINRAIVELTSELQLARMKAIAMHQPVTVTFDPATDQYTVSWTDPATQASVEKPVQLDPKGSRISFDSSPPGGAATPDDNFVFNNLGFIQPSLGGTIGNIYLVDNTNGRRIGIATTVAGAIEEQRWNGSSWSGPVLSYTPSP